MFSPRRSLAAHPRVGDSLMAGALAAVGWLAAVGNTTGAIAWLSFAALHLPLVWRRRAPVIVFWSVAALTALADLVAGLDTLAQALVPLFAYYAVARYRSWRHLLPIVLVFAGVIVLALRGADINAPDAGFLVAVFALVGLIGVAAQARQAFQDERAERIEREREQQAELAVTAERARIAREMHDIVAHNVAVMIALADGATAAATSSPPLAADAMRKVAATGRQALTELRRLVGVLRDGDAGDHGFAPQPGVGDIDELVEQVRAAGLRVTVTTEGEQPACGPGVGLAVYRITQEALTNTLKHAGPLATAHVRFTYVDGAIEVEITDDGAGRPATTGDQGRAGHGLAGMRERVAPYGGQVDAGPRPGGGCWLACRWPTRPIHVTGPAMGR